VLDKFVPYLVPGRLMPVVPLDDEAIALFLSVMEIVDLSPNLPAAFLPPEIADHLLPPAAAEELHHIEKGKPSFKILILRPGNEERVLCAEISAHAHKPGVDIFQSGALLGTYNFENQKDLFAELNKIVRAHIWQRGKWTADETERYTVNWFEKVLDLRKKTVRVEADRSFFHSPTLIRSNRIDAMFVLIAKVIQNHLADPDHPLKANVLKIMAQKDPAAVDRALSDLMDKVVFEFLSVMKDCELVDFDKMTDKETERFNRESARTIERLVRHVQLHEMMPKAL
jgi:hypothetical protein